MPRCRHASLTLASASASSSTLKRCRATFSSAVIALLLGANTTDRMCYPRRLGVQPMSSKQRAPVALDDRNATTHLRLAGPAGQGRGRARSAVPERAGVARRRLPQGPEQDPGPTKLRRLVADLIDKTNWTG